MKINIRTKLIGGFAVVVVMMVVVFAIGWNGLNSLNAAADHIVHEQLPEDAAIRDLELQLALQGELYMEYALTGEEEFLHEAREKTDLILEEAANLEEQLAGETELLAQLKVVEAEYTELNREEEEFVRLYTSGDIAAAIEHLHLVSAEEAQMEEQLAEMAHEIELGVEASFEAAEATHNQAVQMMIGVTIVATIAVGDSTTTVNITTSDEIGEMAKSYGAMQLYLTEASEIAEKIGDGDLTVTVKPKSEEDVLGNALYRMVTNLRQLIGQVGQSANSLTNTSSQLSTAAGEAGAAVQGIAATSQQVAKGAEDQGVRSQEVSSGMDQLSSAIDQVASGSQEQAGAIARAAEIVGQVSKATEEVAQNAQSASEGSRKANDAADSGKDLVNRTGEGMERIKTAVETVATRIGELGDQSAEIGKIVNVIEDIAAQTNLLALNAAIEAARAGEQGRGFAVVADEVRKLAERVTDATTEIANLIDGVQKGVAESVKATEEGTKEVEDGAALAQEAGVALDQISESVSSVANQIEQISAASQQVSASSEEMVKTIDQVSGVVEQNSAAAEQMSANSSQVIESVTGIAGIIQQNGAAIQEMSASSEEMSAQVQEVVAASETLDTMAQELREVVSAFKVDGAKQEDAAAD